MVVKQPDGTQRDLTQDEEDTIAENEEMENYAAHLLRLEEERLHEDFTSTELREWEAWAAKAGRSGEGVKRARVQVLVQGQGGRIIRQENWLAGLRDGESLAYSVSVKPAEVDTDGDCDPTAASSGDVAPEEMDGPPAAEPERETQDALGQDALLPVSGLGAPDLCHAHAACR